MKIKSVIGLLRPRQWLKNLIIFFPPFLGGELLVSGMPYVGLIPFLGFCLASSAGYIVNDIFDRERDALHPRKKHRSLPSGIVSVRCATLICTLLIVVALLLALTVSIKYLIILVGYLIISMGYSIRLKEIPLVDIFTIVVGFLFRLQAGGEAFNIQVSEWLFLSVFLLAVFLSTGKRLCEKRSLGADAGQHRKALDGYPEGFLDGVMYMTGGAVLVTYTMYIISRHMLIFSVPLCCFGLFRYIYRVKSGLSGDPTESLLQDLQLLTVGICWVVLTGWGIYGW